MLWHPHRPSLHRAAPLKRAAAAPHHAAPLANAGASRPGYPPPYPLAGCDPSDTSAAKRSLSILMKKAKVGQKQRRQAAAAGGGSRQRQQLGAPVGPSCMQIRKLTCSIPHHSYCPPLRLAAGVAVGGSASRGFRHICWSTNAIEGRESLPRQWRSDARWASAHEQPAGTVLPAAVQVA